MGETFVVPEVVVQKDTLLIPGTDGDKMSKSKNNTINIFLSDKELRKQIMSIETDSTPMELPKNIDTCTIFALFKLVASDLQITEMTVNYKKGNYGYGHAKQALFELIIEKYSKERELFNYYLNNRTVLDEKLQLGAIKARSVAQPVLQRVRNILGY